MVALQRQSTDMELSSREETFDHSDDQSYQPLSRHDWLSALYHVQGQTIEAQDRLYWMLQLRDGFDFTTCTAPYTVADYQRMLDLAARLCDWVMIVEISRVLLSLDSGWLSVNEYVNTVIISAEASVLLGDSSQALAILKCALLNQYDNLELLNCYRWAQSQHQSLLKDSHTVSNGISENTIGLIPLESHHINGFRWAYINQSQSRKSVAELCNLPNFGCDDDWLTWLQNCRGYPNHYLYAVIHAEWGFIGSVCLEVFNGTGFFYYWLGEDFQGYGFGPQAVAILLAMGEQHKGMKCCYAKVYDDNQTSQKALRKIGFRRLPMRMVAPHDNELLYYLGPDRTHQQSRAELLQLFADMVSDYGLQVTQGCLEV